MTTQETINMMIDKHMPMLLELGYKGIKYIDEQGMLACVHLQYSIESKLFDKRVVAATWDGYVCFNLKTTNRAIDNMCMMTKTPIEHVRAAIIEHIVLHEARHAWQAHHSTHVFNQRFAAFSLKGMGNEDAAEYDADMYAIAYASNDYSIAIGTVMYLYSKMDDYSMMPTTQKTIKKEIDDACRDARKHVQSLPKHVYVNPIVKELAIGATVGIALGLLIKYAIKKNKK